MPVLYRGSAVPKGLLSLMKSHIAKRKHKWHLVKFKSNVILVVHKEIVLGDGAISHCGLFHFIATGLFPEICNSQYFKSLHLQSSSALDIGMGENSLTCLDDNELRASCLKSLFSLLRNKFFHFVSHRRVLVSGK